MSESVVLEVPPAESASLGPTEIAELILAQGTRALGASAGIVYVLDRAADRLALLVAEGYPEGAVAAFRAVPLDSAMPAAEVARGAPALFIESPADLSSRYPEVSASLAPTRSAAFTIVPLEVGPAIVGVLVLSYSEARSFSASDRAFVSALANLGAHALERARFHELEQLARGRTSFLARAGHALSSSLTDDTVLDSIARMAVPELAEWCSIDVLARAKLRQVAVAHVDPAKVAFAREFRRRYPADLSAPRGLGRVIRENVSELYAHISDDMLVAGAREAEHLALMRSLGLESMLCVPIAARGRTLGAVTFVSSGGRRYDEGDVAFAEELAHRIGIAIDNARLYRAAQSLAELGRRAISSPADEVLGAATDLIAEELDVELAEVLVVEGSALVRRASVGFTRIPGPTSVKPGHLAGFALSRGDVVVVPDASLETRFAMGDRLHEESVASAMAMSIPGHDRPLGVIGAYGLRARPFGDEDAQLLRGIASVLAAAITKERAEEELEAGRARLSGILESAMDAIITVDEAQRVILFNHAAEVMFGYEATEVVGGPLAMLLPARFRERHAGHVARFGETGATNRAMGALGTLGARRKNGDEFPIEATISKLQHRGQRLFTVILRDVTERLQAEAQRELHRHELEEASRHKDDFLAMLGHELRNPLAAIQNAAQLSKITADVDAQARARAVVERQVGHMARLIDDLLDVSRIMRGKIELRPEVIDLTEVVATVVSDHRSAAERRGVRLESEPSASVWVEGDRARLVQIAGNLIDNALKFTGAGGRVRTEVLARPEGALLVVEDSGIGIAEDNRRRIFEPFRQADNSLGRSGGGLGLGLSVVRGLAELHGGAVDVESDGPGRGSRFTVRLPATMAPRTPRPPSVAPESPLGHRVLVIEDNHDAAAMLDDILSLAGCEVRVAHDARTGLALCESFAPHLVLCDIGLPGELTGHDVARGVHAAGMPKRPWLVALTGYGRSEDRRAALESGFDEHLTKPVAFDRLRTLLRDLPSAS